MDYMNYELWLQYLEWPLGKNCSAVILPVCSRQTRKEDKAAPQQPLVADGSAEAPRSWAVSRKLNNNNNDNNKIIN